MERIVIAQERLSVPSPTRRQQSSSQLSDLADCPVCNENLEDLGPPSVQELHVKQCLEGGAGTSPQSAKYLVYRLPGESTLVGIECELICISVSWSLTIRSPQASFVWKSSRKDR